MKKRIITIFLAALLLVSTIGAASASGTSFSDVPETAYYADSVAWAVRQGITNGTSAATFSPRNSCTRGQVVTFLWRAHGKPAPKLKNNAFADVAANDYFYDPVLWAIEQGITNGTSATTFSPKSNCTYAQILTFLWRAEGKPEVSTALSEKYADQYYENAVGWADASHMMDDTGTFSPNTNCPRCDVVTYLYRSFQSSSTWLTPNSHTAFDASAIPNFSGTISIELNNGTPYFTKENLSAKSYEMYGALDPLGRCTTCVAIVGTDIMPTGNRGSISSVTPTGWQSVYSEGTYLFNRCHLIGWTLTGENANARNIITGTRDLNTVMAIYESEIAEYVKKNNAHVLFRVTPVFDGDDLLAKGVLLEAMSVEDKGEAVSLCVFIYNIHTEAGEKAYYGPYVLNINSHVFHKPDCASVKRMKESNKLLSDQSREELISAGNKPCSNCNP